MEGDTRSLDYSTQEVIKQILLKSTVTPYGANQISYD